MGGARVAVCVVMGVTRGVRGWRGRGERENGWVEAGHVVGHGEALLLLLGLGQLVVVPPRAGLPPPRPPDHGASSALLVIARRGGCVTNDGGGGCDGVDDGGGEDGGVYAGEGRHHAFRDHLNNPHASSELLRRDPYVKENPGQDLPTSDTCFFVSGVAVKKSEWSGEPTAAAVVGASPTCCSGLHTRPGRPTQLPPQISSSALC